MSLDSESILRAARAADEYETSGKSTDRAAALAEKLTVQAIPRSWLTEEPPPLDWVWDGTILGGSVTVVLGAGGSGKTYLVLQLAAHIAWGSTRFLGRDLQPGKTVIVSGEDRPESYRRRLHGMRAEYRQRLTRANAKPAEIAKKIAVFDERVSANLCLVSAVGIDLHLVEGDRGGNVTQAVDVEILIAKIKQVGGVRLIVLDPLARLHGCDENSNGLMTALINAAERVATETGAAVLIVHHISKEAAKGRSTHAHVARGGSALTDGARSALVMQPAEAPPAGKRLTHAIAGGQSAEVDATAFSAGRVVQLVHAKSNHAARVPDRYLLRAENSGLLQPCDIVDVDSHANALERLRAWMDENDSPVIFKQTVDMHAKVMFGVGKEKGRHLFDAMVERGELIRAADAVASNPAAKGYRLANTRRPAEDPPATPAGVTSDTGAGGAGNTRHRADPIGGGGSRSPTPVPSKEAPRPRGPAGTRQISTSGRTRTPRTSK